MIDVLSIETKLDELRDEFKRALPFPHVVIQPFFVGAFADAVEKEFPTSDLQFRPRVHLHSHKYATDGWNAFPPTIRKAFEALHSPSFLTLLSAITDIPNLAVDPDLFGGGVHVSRRGGFLDIHADFTEHPTLNKKRCLNALVYFNRDWKSEYNGDIELWDRDVRRCVKKISPQFNRCVLFETSLFSFHGHPTPLACPEGMTRKSFAIYYYCDWARDDEPRLKTTDYRPRPWDYRKRMRKFVRRMLGARLSGFIRAAIHRR